MNLTISNMLGFYAYIRVSTVKQGETGSSLQEQRAAIEAYALRHGLTILQWFEEMETAAKRGRALFNQMLRLLDRRKASGVIIHKIDRSARNLKDWADLGELMDRGVQIHFAYESLDLSSTGGRLAADVQAAVAAHYIRNLRDEVKKGFRGRLRQGLYPWPAPLGYENRGRGAPKTPDLVRAPLIRQAYELYASGQHNLYTLGNELYRRGLRNRNGQRVTRNGLSTLLSNEFYIGLIRIWKTGEIYQGVHEPIVPKSLFDRVQARLSGNIRNSGLRHDFLYRRMLRCHHCGRTLIAERQKGFVYYRCHTTRCPTKCVREDCIDLQIAGALRLLALTEEEYEDLVSVFIEMDGSDKEDLQQHARATKLHRDSLSVRLGRLTDAYLDGSIERELFEERKAALLHERAAADEKIRGIDEYPGSLRAEVTKFLERLQALSHNAKPKDAEERRDLAKDATSNLTIDRKNVVVTWQSPWLLLAKRVESANGEAYRDTARTSTGKISEDANFRARELASEIYGFLKSNAAPSGLGRDVSSTPSRSSFSSLRPHVPGAPLPPSGSGSPGASLGTASGSL